MIAHKYIVGTEAMNIKEKRYHTKSVLPQKYSNSIAMPPSGNIHRGSRIWCESNFRGIRLYYITHNIIVYLSICTFVHVVI